MCVTAFGYARLNVWRENGEKFQLGYVVGYIDGVQLCQRGDQRAMVPTGGRPDYERWRAFVNEYFEDPAHAKQGIPDAMKINGAKVTAEAHEEWGKQRAESMRRAREAAAKATPGASAAPSPDVSAH